MLFNVKYIKKYSFSQWFSMLAAGIMILCIFYPCKDCLHICIFLQGNAMAGIIRIKSEAKI